MIVTNGILKERYKRYSNINNKVSHEIEKGNLLKITKGLYETDENTNGYLLAGSIYGPSYLSFDYALYYYGLIPERVTTFTSATCNKKKKKRYSSIFGNFTFEDVPKTVYPLGIRLIEEGDYSYQIATKEKAICDKLYSLKPIKNLKNLEIVLFEDLRIDKIEFLKININDIEKIQELYHSTNVTLLYKYLRREINE